MVTEARNEKPGRNFVALPHPFSQVFAEVPAVPTERAEHGVPRIDDQFFNLGEAECKKAFELMQELRSKNIKCEIYHEQSKFDKQFKYAEKKNIQYAVIIGSKELAEETCVIKDLKKGEQETIKQEMLSQFAFW